jgi:hypothetical protein
MHGGRELYSRLQLKQKCVLVIERGGAKPAALQATRGPMVRPYHDGDTLVGSSSHANNFVGKSKANLRLLSAETLINNDSRNWTRRC